MAKVTEDREPTEPSEKKHVLTKQEALEMLNAVHTYFNDRDISGRHQTEATAEAMINAGLTDLAESTMDVHNALKAFHRGNYKGAAYLTDDTPVGENIVEQAEGTRFAKFAAGLARDLKSFDALCTGESFVDWDEAAKVVAEVKREKFPKDLTMVEKLDQWQHDQSKGHPPRGTRKG